MFTRLITNYFKPSLYVRSIKHINVSQLKRQGIKLFIADLDNTLAPHYSQLPSKEVMALIRKVHDAGMEFVILSNNVRQRVERFASKANVPFYAAARKPLTFVPKRIMRKYQVEPQQVVFVGDLIIFDTLVANRMNWESILVQPLVTTDFEMSKFNLLLENWVYKHLERRNILRRGEFIEALPQSNFYLL